MTPPPPPTLQEMPGVAIPEKISSIAKTTDIKAMYAYFGALCMATLPYLKGRQTARRFKF